MKKSFAVIGGDLRIVYLAKELAKENIVYSYGFENTKELENVVNINICKDIETAVKNSDLVISSVPLTKNGTDIYMPFSSQNLKINELITILNGKTLIAGAIPNNISSINSIINNEVTNKTNIIDLMNFDELTVLNTIATAEGAISDIILNTSFNLHGSRVLVLGFGRVAKVLAKKLKALDSIVTCAARKDTDFAWMEALGYNVLNINKLNDNSDDNLGNYINNEYYKESTDTESINKENTDKKTAKKLSDFDIIINTVPHLIMDKQKLELINSNCFLLDLASKPGGFDQDYIKQNKLNYKWSLAIPGKVAPITSAKYIKKIIYKLLGTLPKS